MIRVEFENVDSRTRVFYSTTHNHDRDNGRRELHLTNALLIRLESSQNCESMFLFSTRCKIQARKQSRYLSFSRIAAIVVLVAVVYILICHWSKKCSKHIVPFSILHRRVDLSCFIFSSGKVTKTKALDDRSIFLVASACQPLEFRKACAVESAAKYHPDWPVHIILYGRKKVNPNTKTFMSNLKAYRNVFITKIDVPEYFIGTPFEPLLTPESLQEMDFPEYFVSDLVKIATLYNHGGVCLSWNVVVQRSIRTLSNDFFVKEPENKISSAILRLTKSEVGKEMISNIARYRNYNIT